MKTKNLLTIAILLFFFSNVPLFAQQQIISSSIFNSTKSAVGDGRTSGSDTGNDPIGGDTSGGAGKEIGIYTNVPSITLLVKKATTISWSGNRSMAPYTISVTANDGTSNILYKATTNLKEWTIPFDALSLKQGNSFTIEISDSSPTNLFSAPSIVKFVDQQFLNKTLNNLRDTPHFQNANRSDKIVMKAMQLEINDLNFEASNIYQSHIANDDYDVFLLNMRDKFNSNMKSKTEFGNDED